MACEMQQITRRMSLRRESVESLQADLPLALRLRSAWTCGDIWDLRKSCEDSSVSYPDCPSPTGTELSDCIKIIDDSASTCDGDDVSFTSEETGTDSDSVPERLNWADEMWEDAPSSQDTPPGIFAAPLQSFAVPPGQWVNTSGNLGGPPGHFAVQAVGNAPCKNTKYDLVQSVKEIQRSNPEAWFGYTAENGNNVRDPRKHSVQFLKGFIRQYNQCTAQ